MTTLLTKHCFRSTLFFVALVAHLGVAGQTFRWEIGGRLSRLFGSTDAVGAYQLGAAYEYEFDQHWAVSLGLSFNGRGWKERNTLVPIVDLEDRPIYEADGVTQRRGIKSVSVSTNYLTLPLLAHYYWRLSEGRYLLFGAGVYGGYGIMGKRKIKGDTALPGAQKYLYSTNTFSDPSMSRWDVGVILKCGYQPSEKWTVGIEADWGLLHTSTQGGKNAAWLLTVAYRLVGE